MTLFLQTLVDGILVGGVYALIALGLVLVYKSTKVLNLAYGQILMLLAYIGTVFFVSLELHIVPSLLLVMMIGVVLGLVLERFTMRPLIGQPVMPMIAMTLVIGILIEGIITIAWQDKDIVLSNFIPRESISLSGIYLSQTNLWSFVIAVAAFLLLFLLFRYTKIGLVMRAVAEDHHTSQSMGISVKLVFAISWAISCLAAAIAALLLGSMSVVGGGLSHVGISKAVPVILLGGLESVPGAFLGGLIIGLAEVFGSTYIGPEYGDLFPYVLMLLILLIKPHGLFGLKVIERI